MSTSPAENTYPELYALISGWFHQDFDIVGETVEIIIDAYLAATQSQKKRELENEIKNFIHLNDKNLDIVFRNTFKPDIDPAAFSGSTMSFLGEILCRLRSQ